MYSAPPAHLAGAQRRMWPVAVGQHSSELHHGPQSTAGVTAVPERLPAPLGTGKSTKDNAALKPGHEPGAIRSPAGALGSLGSPSSPVTLCVCLSRAMVCSQRNTSLSQSPRVGFLSSLLPQSKKSPSRLSPAQAPSQAQSLAKKEPFSGQVSARPAFLTPAKWPLTPDGTFRPYLFSP